MLLSSSKAHSQKVQHARIKDSLLKLPSCPLRIFPVGIEGPASLCSQHSLLLPQLHSPFYFWPPQEVIHSTEQRMGGKNKTLHLNSDLESLTYAVLFWGVGPEGGVES